MQCTGGRRTRPSGRLRCYLKNWESPCLYQKQSPRHQAYASSTLANLSPACCSLPSLPHHPPAPAPLTPTQSSPFLYKRAHTQTEKYDWQPTNQHSIQLITSENHSNNNNSTTDRKYDRQTTNQHSIQLIMSEYHSKNKKQKKWYLAFKMSELGTWCRDFPCTQEVGRSRSVDLDRHFCCPVKWRTSLQSTVVVFAARASRFESSASPAAQGRQLLYYFSEKGMAVRKFPLLTRDTE